MALVTDLKPSAGVFRAGGIGGSAPLGCNSTNQRASFWNGHRGSRLYQNKNLASIGKCEVNSSGTKYFRRTRHLGCLHQICKAARQRLHLAG